MDVKPALEGPPMLWVEWDCRRCGFTGGVARTTFTVPEGFPEAAMRQLLVDCKKHLIQRHYQLHQCLATVEDFTLRPTVPQDKVLVDRR